jgi:hypothetical protein
LAPPDADTGGHLTVEIGLHADQQRVQRVLDRVVELTAAAQSPTSLNVKETMTLGFEAVDWRYAGAKEATVRDVLGESATRYYQRLNKLIDRVDAEAFAPQLIHRLRRMRELRRAERSANRAVHQGGPA